MLKILIVDSHEQSIPLQDAKEAELILRKCCETNCYKIEYCRYNIKRFGMFEKAAFSRKESLEMIDNLIQKKERIGRF